LAILNLLGGIVSGIWLVVQHDWGTVVAGIALFFCSTWILAIALLPSVLLAVPAAYLADKGKTLGVIFFGGLSSLYVLALLSVWCCGMLFLFTVHATSANLIPRLIWSSGVATGPWAYMASKDQGGDGQGFGSTMSVFFAEVAYVVVMLVTIFAGVTLLEALAIFGGFMLFTLLLQTFVTVGVFLERRRTAY
jgi:hypothetical protein